MSLVVSINRQKAIDDTLKIMEPYLKQEHLDDAQAARIGRTLYANLRQADREDAKEKITKI